METDEFVSPASEHQDEATSGSTRNGRPPESAAEAADARDQTAVPEDRRGGESLEESLLPVGGLPVLQLYEQAVEPDRFKRRAVLLIYCGIALVLLLAGIGVLVFRKTAHLDDPSALVVGGILVGAAILLLFAGLAHSLFIKNEFATSDGSRRDGFDDESTDLKAYDQVARLNQRLIASYHRVTTAQARSSYRNSQVAMAIGLLILAAGGVAVVRASSASGQVIVGSLTALGGAFSAYLGSTFLRSYSRALEQMNYFFGQPLVNSYLLTAERLAKDLKGDESRDEALKGVITRTLDGAAQTFGAIAPQPSQAPGRRRPHSRIGNDSDPVG